MPYSHKFPFWAKARWTEQGMRFHPLVDHAADVAACLEALLGRPVIRQRLEHAAGGVVLDTATIARLCALAVLHDFGKANTGFQRLALHRDRRSPGHIRPAMALLMERSAEARPFRQRLAAALDAGQLQCWVAKPDELNGLLTAILAHHGMPPAGGAFVPDIWTARDGLDPFQGIAELTAAARHWFPHAFELGGAPMPSTPPFLHAFAGLLMLADWLGSDESFFPYAEPGTSDRMPFARERAAAALAAIGLSPDAARRRLGAAPLSFEAAFPGKAPRPAQRTMQSLDGCDTGGLTILEAETGSGKTEAALRHFLALFARGEVDGLYLALPTRTAAVQIHGRIQADLKRLLGADAPPVVLAVPGYVRVDDTDAERRLPGFDVLWPDDLGDGRGWAAEHPKRYCAATVAVGTIDQALMAALQVRHAELRGAALLRQLLVVDEVHASDPYMATLLAGLLEAHRVCGGHALLMSATLGSGARARLLGTPLPNLEVALKTPYPLIATRSGMAPPIDPPKREKEVAVELADADDAHAVAGRALAAARSGAKVLVVRNTVRDALTVQRALEELDASSPELLLTCAGRPVAHHSRFAREDRLLLDAALEERFGKQAQPGGAVAVTTQTAEQSLDLDADLLITDLCPADVLLQRIGRLHRHDRARPEGFAQARVVVLSPPADALTAAIAVDGRVRRGVQGLGTVYPDLLAVEATRRQLAASRVLVIPALNRTLVEHATHPEALSGLAAELGGAWPVLDRRLRGEESACRTFARLNALDWRRPLPEAFGEAEGEIRTRLGADDRLIVFAPPTAGPFGRTVTSLAVPGWISAGCVPPEAAPEEVVADGGVLRFQLGALAMVYDRLGLRAQEDGAAMGESVG